MYKTNTFICIHSDFSVTRKARTLKVTQGIRVCKLLVIESCKPQIIIDKGFTSDSVKRCILQVQL